MRRACRRIHSAWPAMMAITQWPTIREWTRKSSNAAGDARNPSPKRWKRKPPKSACSEGQLARSSAGSLSNSAGPLASRFRCAGSLLEFRQHLQHEAHVDRVVAQDQHVAALHCHDAVRHFGKRLEGGDDFLRG